MLIICKECGHEAPQHADWCHHNARNVKVCSVCRGARGKHSPGCSQAHAIGKLYGLSDKECTDAFTVVVEKLRENCKVNKVNESDGVRVWDFSSTPLTDYSGISILNLGDTTNDRVNKLETELRECMRRLNKLESGR